MLINLQFNFYFRHHNRVHRDNRTTANSLATINSVATGQAHSTNATASNASAESSGTDVYDATTTNTSQVWDLEYLSPIFLYLFNFIYILYEISVRCTCC